MSFEVINKGQTFDIYMDGRLFTSCVYESKFIRPFVGPVLASNGVSFTRADEKHEEHPHQRSLFVGIGEINGVDFWNESHDEVDTQHGAMKYVSTVKAQSGETASVAVKLLWQDYEGNKYLDEIRTIEFSKVSDTCVRVDMSLELTASYTDIEVGATKEAGPLGIRVTDAMRADRDGSFTNSDGGINEEGCWGKEALWCNYSAEIGGKKLGIAAFDRRTNERYPTTWHIRNYGLMAANNLFFKGGYSVKKGETVKYDFTVCFWEDSFDAAAFEKTL